ncbi:MAG: hypothetical protein U0790_02345 [Isosphaeraceae bacterium]
MSDDMSNAVTAPGSRDSEPPAIILLRRGMTGLIALWCLILLAVWIPHYLTWPWYVDHEHFAILAQNWESGRRPYRDVFSFQFPGEIYVFWILGKITGWCNTVAFYALDAALVTSFGILLVIWGRRLSGHSLPGLIGFSSFLLYYLSLRFNITAQREVQVAIAALFSVMIPAIWPGPGGRLASAIAFGLALLIRPQVVLLLPAILLAVDRSARSPGDPWRKTLIAVLTWGSIAGLVFALGLLPLALNGILDDFWNSLQSMRLSSYNRKTSRGGILETLARLDPLSLPKNLLLATGIILVLLPWNRAEGPTRRFVPIVLAAAFGVAFYHAISPNRYGYHTTPQVAVAAMAVTLVGAQLARGETRPLVRLAVLGALFLLFGAREKPRALDVLTPGDRTYGLSESLHILRTGELPLRPAVGVEEAPSYSWPDARAAILYLRDRVPPGVPVAPLLLESRTAIISAARRPSALPAEGHDLAFTDNPSLMNRVITALNTTDNCVVLWNPSTPLKKDPRFEPLWQAVRDRFEPEVRFGNFEIWRLRSPTE